jgi:LysM repeat protein
MNMKTWGLIGIVVGVHCALIAAVFFISGCGTPRPVEQASVTPPLPPPTPPKPVTDVKPIENPTRTEPVPVKEPPKPTGGGEYTVQAGDTLAVIAKRCHVTQAELIEANKLTDPNKLKVGQKLIVPPTGQLPPTTTPKPPDEVKPTPETVPAGGIEYVVKLGDNLSKIAAHYGIKISALREANKLQSDKLKVGQKLVIPGAKAPPVDDPVTPPAIPKIPPAPIIENPGLPPKPEPASNPAPMTGTAPKPPAGYHSGITHSVLAGEDLNSIAKLYNVTVDELVEYNQLTTNRVKVGQSLKIP